MLDIDVSEYHTLTWTGLAGYNLQLHELTRSITSTYQLSKFIANIIKPASRNIHGTDLHDTFQFLEQIPDVDLSNVFMVSFDVQSLRLRVFRLQ